MDFDFKEEEQAINELASQILDDKVTHAHLRDMTDADQHFDQNLWKTMADSGLIGATLPEEHGGAGLGFLAATAVLEQIGSHAAPVPMLETVVMAAQPIAHFGTAEQRAALLPGIAAGEVVATAALVMGERATVSGETVSGTAPLVPYGMEAGVVLVPSSDGMRVVTTSQAGVTISAHQTTTGHPEATMQFDAAASERLGSASADEVEAWTRLRVDSAICSILAGACEAALGLAADYAKVREQFGRAIATFQAVSQRAGDAYIDTEAVRLTSRQAAWRISADREAAEQVAIARWWASEAGFRVMHAATHLHGGVGVDRDYPLHRFFLMTRQLELTLGNAEEQLQRLGDLIAARA